MTSSGSTLRDHIDLFVLKLIVRTCNTARPRLIWQQVGSRCCCCLTPTKTTSEFRLTFTIKIGSGTTSKNSHGYFTLNDIMTEENSFYSRPNRSIDIMTVCHFWRSMTDTKCTFVGWLLFHFHFSGHSISKVARPWMSRPCLDLWHSNLDNTTETHWRLLMGSHVRVIPHQVNNL